MENEHALSGLIRKRAEIAGQLEAAQTQVRQFIIDIDAVDATIRLFAPDVDLEDIRPKPLPPRHAARRGETSRFILGVLRETATPLTLSDLTLRVMQPLLASMTTPVNLRNKISRGRYTAVFLLQCLEAMGCQTVDFGSK